MIYTNNYIPIEYPINPPSIIDPIVTGTQSTRTTELTEEAQKQEWEKVRKYFDNLHLDHWTQNGKLIGEKVINGWNVPYAGKELRLEFYLKNRGTKTKVHFKTLIEGKKCNSKINLQKILRRFNHFSIQVPGRDTAKKEIMSSFLNHYPADKFFKGFPTRLCPTEKARIRFNVIRKEFGLTTLDNMESIKLLAHCYREKFERHEETPSKVIIDDTPRLKDLLYFLRCQGIR